MTTTSTIERPEISASEQFREMILAGAEGETVSVLEAQSLTFACGLTVGDFQRAVDLGRVRREAAGHVERAAEARAQLSALDEERDRLIAEGTEKLASLAAAYESACKAIHDGVAAFDRGRAEEIHRLQNLAAAGGRAHDTLLRTADRGIDAKLADMDRQLQSLAIDRRSVADKAQPRKRVTVTGESGLDNARSETTTVEDAGSLRRAIAAADAKANDRNISADARQDARARSLAAERRLSAMGQANSALQEIDDAMAELTAERRRLEQTKLDWRKFAIG